MNRENVEIIKFYTTIILLAILFVAVILYIDKKIPKSEPISESQYCSRFFRYSIKDLPVHCLKFYQ